MVAIIITTSYYKLTNYANVPKYYDCALGGVRCPKLKGRGIVTVRVDREKRRGYVSEKCVIANEKLGLRSLRTFPR